MWGVIANAYKFFFLGGDENVLKLNSDDGCITLSIY